MESQQTASSTRDASFGNEIEAIDYEALYKNLVIEHGILREKLYKLEHAFRFIAGSIKWEIFENRLRHKVPLMISQGLIKDDIMIGPDYRELYPAEKSRYIMEFMKVAECESSIAIKSANMELVRKDDIHYDPIKAVHAKFNIPENEG